MNRSSSFLVIGTGQMGSALAYDLVRSEGVAHVTVADIDLKNAEKVAARLPSNNVRPVGLDVNYFDDVIELMRGHDCVIGAVSYRYNYALSKAAIEAGAHFCDLGGNDEVVDKQLSLNSLAHDRGVTIVPNCGLAPGLANILAAGGAAKFETLHSMKMRVGGLPQQPKPPLNYQLVFSVEGLLNEYSGSSAVIRSGRVTKVPTLTELESIEFPHPFGTLEAFHTSGGTSLLPKLYEGKVLDLDYKTIRYPGHCEKFKALLDIGFADNDPMTIGSNVLTEKEIFIELLKRKLPSTGPDVVLLRVTIDGLRSGRERRLTYNLIDFHSETDNITAMMRTTSYPTSVIAQMLAAGSITGRGVLTPEQCVPVDPLIAELRKRGVDIKETWS